MKLKNIIESIVNEYLNEDYSGEYNSLYNFISDNNLENLFVSKYNKYNNELSIENWEDFVYGEMGSDEEIISDLIGNNYLLFYDDDSDSFIITKRNRKKLKYKIVESSSDDIIDVIEKSGIFTEYKPRFAVIINNKIVGGSTYIIDNNNIYNFDIGILDEYQGYGIGKDLINYIIQDAKSKKVNGIKARVVNKILFNFFIKNGFKTSVDQNIKYVYKIF